MLKKQRHGSIIVTSIVRKDPIKDITRPKKGMERPTIKVEITSAVLITMEYMRDFTLDDGISSSRLIATGDMVNAYLVNGLTTVVQTAIFDTTRFFGMLRVNCDSVASPNIVYPMTATPAYRIVQIPKQAKRTEGNWFGFAIEV